MNIVYLEFRPFSRFVRNGFRQRAGRILLHLNRSNRVKHLTYVWWNEDPFATIQNDLTYEEEYPDILWHEARRAPIPFARRLGLTGGWVDEVRIRKAAAACGELADEDLWIWATDPRLAVPARELANRLNGKLCIDLIDNFAVRDEFGGRQRKVFRRAYKDAARLADRIVANNPEMQNYIGIPDAKFRCVLNGVDWQLFHDGKDLPEPIDIVSIPRPRVGFIGILSSLTDVSFLNAVAEEIFNCEVIVVGSTKDANKLLHPRIHDLGMKPYNEIPSYISSFDVCVSIYRHFHSAPTPFGDSQKIKEYLAAGKPVVTSYSPNSTTDSTYVHVARNVNEFVDMVCQAIGDPVDAEFRDKISFSVIEHDWKGRIIEILDFLEDGGI